MGTLQALTRGAAANASLPAGGQVSGDRPNSRTKAPDCRIATYTKSTRKQGQYESAILCFSKIHINSTHKYRISMLHLGLSVFVDVMPSGKLQKPRSGGAQHRQTEASICCKQGMHSNKLSQTSDNYCKYSVFGTLYRATTECNHGALQDRFFVPDAVGESRRNVAMQDDTMRLKKLTRNTVKEFSVFHLCDPRFHTMLTPNRLAVHRGKMRWCLRRSPQPARSLQFLQSLYKKNAAEVLLASLRKSPASPAEAVDRRRPSFDTMRPFRYCSFATSFFF